MILRHNRARSRIAAAGSTIVLVTLVAAFPGRADARRKHKVSAKSGDPFSEVLAQESVAAKTHPKERHKHAAVPHSTVHGQQQRHASATKAAIRKEKVSCVSSLHDGKERASSSHLREAKAALDSCQRPVCGRAVRRACDKLASAVEADMPSVVPAVTNAPESGVEVKMDGQVLTSNVDGHAIPIDPGMHEFTFATEGKVFATQSALIERGQRKHAVTAVRSRPESSPTAVVAASEKSARAGQSSDRARKLATPIPDPQVVDSEAAPDRDAEATAPGPERSAPERARGPYQASSSSSWPIYALAGAGALGVGGYAALTWKGRHDNSTLMSSCAPDCNPASVHHVRMVYLAADVSLGIGIVALAASTYLYLHAPSTTESKAAATAEASRPRIRGFDMSASAGGTFASMTGTF